MQLRMAGCHLLEECRPSTVVGLTKTRFWYRISLTRRICLAQISRFIALRFSLKRFVSLPNPLTLCVGRDSSVGIVTRYGPDGPGIESRRGATYFAPFQAGLGSHPASYTMGTGSFPGVKRPGRGVDHPPPSSAEVKERLELPLLPLWAFVVCSRANFYITYAA
jgi:hypothetical protein